MLYNYFPPPSCGVAISSSSTSPDDGLGKTTENHTNLPRKSMDEPMNEGYKVIKMSGNPTDSVLAQFRAGRCKIDRACGKEKSDSNAKSAPEMNNVRERTFWRRNRFATWNVQGLVWHPGKLQIIEKEMESCGIMLCSEWRKRTGRNGVAIIVPLRLRNSVRGYNVISDKIIYGKFQGVPNYAKPYPIYAPMAAAEEQEIDEFYGKLEKMLYYTESKNCVVGNFGLGEKNKKGKRLMNFCLQQKLFITNTYFHQHPQIIYLEMGAWKPESIINAKTNPEADCGNDHQLLVMDFRLRFKKRGKRTLGSAKLTEGIEAV
ncbi:hypothetical protein ACFW04_011916 [Cataglyphis niger]